MWVVIIALTIIVDIIIVQTNMTTGNHTKFEVITALTLREEKQREKLVKLRKTT